jgi:hypothetical protein
MNTKPICLNSDAFYELLDKVVEHITDTYNLEKAERWISADACMELLNIKSRNVLFAPRWKAHESSRTLFF